MEGLEPGVRLELGQGRLVALGDPVQRPLALDLLEPEEGVVVRGLLAGELHRAEQQAERHDAGPGGVTRIHHSGPRSE